MIKFSAEAKYLGVILDSKLTWKSHIKAKIAKFKRLLFTIKNCIAKTVGPMPSITRQAYKTLVVSTLSYGCHLFANRINTLEMQKDLSRVNRLACLSLGSVPPGAGTPSMAMEVLYNLRPLDLEMERIALKTYSSIKNRLPYTWDGLPSGDGIRVGHLRHWDGKLNQSMGMTVNGDDSDQKIKSRLWERNL